MMVAEFLAPGPIVVTDTTFSSNRFAWTHQVHKLDLLVALQATEYGKYKAP
jgi:hypothetical protein